MDCAEFTFHMLDTTAYFLGGAGACTAAFFAYRAYAAQKRQVTLVTEERDAARDQLKLAKEQAAAAIRSRTPVFDLAKEFPPLGIAGVSAGQCIVKEPGLLVAVMMRAANEPVGAYLLLENMLPHTDFFLLTVSGQNLPEHVTIGDILTRRAIGTQSENPRPRQLYTLPIVFSLPAPTIELVFQFQTSGGDLIKQTYRCQLDCAKFDLLE